MVDIVFIFVGNKVASQIVTVVELQVVVVEKRHQILIDGLTQVGGTTLEFVHLEISDLIQITVSLELDKIHFVNVAYKYYLSVVLIGYKSKNSLKLDRNVNGHQFLETGVLFFVAWNKV